MATLALDRCPIVLVGAWNRAIFSPQWVLERVFPSEEQLSAEFGFASQPMVAYSTSSCRLQVLPGQVRTFPLSSEDGLRASESAARAVLGRLPETPVGGVGLNVGINEDEPPDLVLRLLDLSDTESLSRLAQVRATSIRHSLAYAVDGNLTLNVEKVAQGQVRFDLNFHWNVPDAQTGAERIRERAPEVLAFSVDLLRRVYGVEVQ